MWVRHVEHQFSKSSSPFILCAGEKFPISMPDTRETVDNPILPKILSCLPCAWTPVKNYGPNNVEQLFHIGCVLDAAVFGQEAGTG
jgi:hypothetical protein